MGGVGGVAVFRREERGVRGEEGGRREGGKGRRRWVEVGLGREEEGRWRFIDS